MRRPIQELQSLQKQEVAPALSECAQLPFAMLTAFPAHCSNQFFSTVLGCWGGRAQLCVMISLLGDS